MTIIVGRGHEFCYFDTGTWSRMLILYRNGYQFLWLYQICPWTVVTKIKTKDLVLDFDKIHVVYMENYYWTQNLSDAYK